MTKRRIILGVVALCLGAGWGWAEALKTAEPKTAAERFGSAQEMLVQADEERDKGNMEPAIALYRETLAAYMDLSRQYPDWQPGVTRFRLNYCNDQLESLLKKVRPVATDEDLSDESEAGPSTNTPAPLVLPAPKNAVELASIKAEIKEFLAGGEIEKARASLMKGMRIDPDNSGIRTLMGVLHCQAGEFENAVYLMTQLIEEAPSDGTARIVLATAYFGMGRFADAKNELEKALEIHPKSSETRHNLAQVALALSPPDIDAARKHYRAALELGGEPDPDLEFLRN